jgi:PAS domain S-box-containing protein
MRVGELSRRTGVGVSTLRAWEQRFGLLEPERSPSGQRLYAEADVERVAAVSRLVAEGLTLSAAVNRVVAAGTGALSGGEGEAFLLQQVMQAADQGIWVSREGTTRYANRRMAELMGCSIDELMVRSVLDFVPPEEMELLVERGGLGREGHRQSYEMRLLRADGTSFLAEVRTTPLRDPAGAYKGAVAVVTDITDRSEAEAVARSRAALLDAIGEAVLAARPDGTIIYANPAAERIFGWSAAELLGQNGLELLAGPGAGGKASRIHAKLIAKMRHSEEVVLSRRDGTPFRAHLTGSPVVDDVGTLVGVIGVLRDDTERDGLLGRLRAQDQQAETVALLGAGVVRDVPRDRLLLEAVEAVRRVLQADDAALLELRPDGRGFAVRVTSPHRESVPDIPAGSHSLAGYTALAGKVVTVEDAELERRFDLASPAGVDIEIVAAIAAPVLGAKGVCGVLIASRRMPRRFNESAAHFMQSIANVAGVALQQPGEASSGRGSQQQRH